MSLTHLFTKSRQINLYSNGDLFIFNQLTYCNNDKVVQSFEIDIDSFSKKFPNKKIWHDHMVAIGKYMPSISCYRWGWGLKKFLND